MNKNSLSCSNWGKYIVVNYFKQLIKRFCSPPLRFINLYENYWLRMSLKYRLHLLNIALQWTSFLFLLQLCFLPNLDCFLLGNLISLQKLVFEPWFAIELEILSTESSITMWSLKLMSGEHNLIYNLGDFASKVDSTVYLKLNWSILSSKSWDDSSNRFIEEGSFCSIPFIFCRQFPLNSKSFIQKSLNTGNLSYNSACSWNPAKSSKFLVVNSSTISLVCCIEIE